MMPQTNTIEKNNLEQNELTGTGTGLNRRESSWRRYAGFGMSICSALCFALEKIIAKYAISNGFHSLLVLSCSKLIPSIIMFCILFKKRKEELLPKDELLVVAGYVFFNTLGTYCLFTSLSYVTAFDSTVLFNTNIIFAIAVSSIFFNYKMSLHDLFSVIFLLSGIIFMFRPTFIFGPEYRDNFNWMDQLKGSALSLTAGLFRAFHSGCTRKAVHTSIFMLLFLSSSVMFLVFSICSYIKYGFNFEYTSKNFLEVLFCGLIVTVGCLLQIKALYLEEVSVVCFALTFDVPFTLILQWACFGKVAGYLELIGMAFVLLGLFIVLYKKWLHKV